MIILLNSTLNPYIYIYYMDLIENKKIVEYTNTNIIQNDLHFIYT